MTIEPSKENDFRDKEFLIRIIISNSGESLNLVLNEF